MKRSKKRAFTLLEVIIVILILGIIASVLVPRILRLKHDTMYSYVKYVMGSVQEGIALYGMESIATGRTPVYPASLDNAADGPASGQNPFFTTVLKEGITDSHWTRSSGSLGGNTVYQYMFEFKLGPPYERPFFWYYPDTGKVEYVDFAM